MHHLTHTQKGTYELYEGTNDHIVKAIIDAEQRTRAIASGDLSTFTVEELMQVVRAFAQERHELEDRAEIIEMAMAPFVAELRRRDVLSLTISRYMRRAGEQPNNAYVNRILAKWKALVAAAAKVESGEAVEGKYRVLKLVQAARGSNSEAASWYTRIFQRANAGGIALPGLLVGAIGNKAGGATAGGAAAAAGGTAVAAGGATSAVAAGGVAATVSGGVAGMAIGAKIAVGVGAVAATSVLVVAAEPVLVNPPPPTRVVAQDQRPPLRASPTPSRSARAPAGVPTSSPRHTPTPTPDPTLTSVGRHTLPSTTASTPEAESTGRPVVTSPAAPTHPVVAKTAQEPQKTAAATSKPVPSQVETPIAVVPSASVTPEPTVQPTTSAPVESPTPTVDPTPVSTPTDVPADSTPTPSAEAPTSTPSAVPSSTVSPAQGQYPAPIQDAGSRSLLGEIIRAVAFWSP